ncbi:epoxide hydrolase family protein [Nonomuraea sp. NPDC005650]|uniref:epoxide hydrolase family protein n=1 Tax=Nonomuraea sp. NPDC005650 TaxID=3157045 RepID=UPI0033AD85BC
MMMDSEVRPFRIDIPQAELDELRRRLEAARWPEELDVTRREDGITVEMMRTLVERWLNGFDWRAHEADLNRFPQLVTEVDGQRVHAVHRPSPRPDSVPLVLLHGWPSTFAEFRRVIDELAEPSGAACPAFDVIVPSLPGYGFSGPLRERGWGAHRMARAIAQLVRRLGYERYLAHGGDAGYQVAAALARVDTPNVAGVHLNLGGVGLAGAHKHERPADEVEARALERYADYVRDKSAYALLNATRPQTVSYGLSDSPVGQLAWIAEKFIDWVDPAYPLPLDDLLTTASIYWFTRTAASSARFYQEEYTANRAPGTGPALDRTYVTVPTGVASYPGELVPPVRRWAKEQYNIVRWVEFPAGGHFAALERPDLVVGALREFATCLGGAG